MRLKHGWFVVAFVVAAVAAKFFVAPVAAGSSTPSKLEGKWKYQSFRPEPGSIDTNPRPPAFVKWSPPGIVTIDSSGTAGILEFTGTPIKLKLELKYTEGNPARVAISAVMPLPNGKAFTNELEGWLVPSQLGKAVGNDNPLVIRGSIVQTSDDIAPTCPQPKFTTGYFVLEPAM